MGLFQTQDLQFLFQVLFKVAFVLLTDFFNSISLSRYVTGRSAVRHAPEAATIKSGWGHS